MAVGDAVSLRKLGRALATLIRAEPVARRLWVSNHGDRVEFWLLTDPTDAATERHLYDLGAALYERFPDARTELHVLNPNLFAAGNALGLLPPNAEEIALHEA